MEPFVGPAEPFIPEGDGFEDPDLLSSVGERLDRKKPAVVRKHNEAIQSQLREGAFLGTLHLPVDYGGFQKTISEQNFKANDRYSRNFKEVTKLITDFDTEVLRFLRENKDKSATFKDTADRYKGLIAEPTSCIKASGPDKKRELRILFPRFGKARREAEPLKTNEPIRGVITFDKEEKDKVMWAYEGHWYSGEELSENKHRDSKSKLSDVWASMEDLQKGVVYEPDRRFWTDLREMLMKSLTPAILGIRDEQKKKTKSKQFRERVWRLFQDLLEDARLVAMNEIRLQEKKVESGGSSTVLQMLMEEGAVVNAANRDCFTPLMIAASNGRTDTLRALLETPGIDLSITNGHGNNAMHYAAMYAHKDCVEILRARDKELRQTGSTDKPKLYKGTNRLGKTPYDLAVVSVILLFRTYPPPPFYHPAPLDCRKDSPVAAAGPSPAWKRSKSPLQRRMYGNSARCFRTRRARDRSVRVRLTAVPFCATLLVS